MRTIVCRLAMAAVPAIVLAALELHHRHLAIRVSAPPPRRETRRISQGLGAGEHLAVTVDHQDRPELDGRPAVPGQLLHGDELARGHAILLASCRDDRFHRRPPDLPTARLGRWRSRYQTTACRRASTPAARHGRAPLARYSARRLRTKSRDRCTRDFTAGRLMPSVSAMSGFGQALDVVQHERGPVVGRQSVDGLLQHLAQLALERVLVDAGTTSRPSARSARP